jgi:tetratricopeptide (TPR) repeat protein
MKNSLALLALLIFGIAPVVAADEKIVAPKPAVMQTPAQKRALELDRIFGKLKLQERHAQRIVELWMQSDSATADVLLQQAMRAMTDGDLDASLKVLDRVVQSYSDYAEAYNKRAMVHFAKNDFEKALVDLARVLELEPRHFNALAGQGAIFLAQNKRLEALKVFQDALSINPHMEIVELTVKELQHDLPGI